MNSAKTEYAGIYGDDTIDLVRNTISIARIEEKGRKFNWHIKPHLHGDLFQLFVLEKGWIEILFETGSRKVNSKCFFTVPINTVHGFNLEPEMNGWVITLANNVLENILKLDADIIFAINEINITSVDTSNQLISDAYSTIHKCIHEFNNNLPAKNLGLQYLVGMLLLRLYRIPENLRETIRFSENSNKLYFQRFADLLKKPNALKKSVEDFAEDLSISPGHLNRICKTVSGKSPKDIIIDHSITEAKKALSNFQLSIGEISYELGFEDPAYFSRLFKKKTGYTPKDFRENKALK